MNIEYLKQSFDKHKVLILILPLILLFLLWYSQVSFIKLGMVFAFLLLMLVITNEFLAIIFFITIAFTLSYAMRMLGLPGKLEYISDFTIIIIFMYSIITGKKKLYAIDVILLVNIIFIIVSTVIGDNPFMIKIKGLSFYLRYPMFAIALLRLRFTAVQFKRLISYIMILAFLQIPTSIIQRLAGFVPDNSGGFLALNSSTICAVLMNIVFIIMLASMMVYGIKRKYVLLSVSLLIPLVLSSARAGFIYFAFSAVFMFFVYMTYIRYSSQHSGIITFVGIIVMLVVIYVTLVYVLPVFEPQNASAVTLLSSEENLRNYVLGSETTGKLKRIESLIFGYNYLKMDIVNLLIGAGPGSTVQSESFGSGIFASFYGKIFYSRLSMAAFLVDTGILGILLHIMTYIYFIVYSFTNAIYIKDKFFRVIGYALPAICLLMITSSVYTSVWNQEALQVVFWILAVSVFSAGHETRKQRVDNVIIYDDEYYSTSRTMKSAIVDHDFFNKIRLLKENDIKNITILVPSTDNAMEWLQFNKHMLKRLHVRVMLPGRRENYNTINTFVNYLDRIHGCTVLIGNSEMVDQNNADLIFTMEDDQVIGENVKGKDGYILKMSNLGMLNLKKMIIQRQLKSMNEIFELVKDKNIASMNTHIVSDY